MTLLKSLGNNMSVYFTSDLHFGHKVLVEGLRHSTIEENAKLIINNWNKTVNKHDLVYLLGDISMDNPKMIAQYLPLLHGKIYVVGGNHDTRRCCKLLTEMNIPVLGCVDYKGCILTHAPISHDEAKYHIANIHGHIHRFNTTEYCSPHHYNVNCEFHDYTPISFDEITKSISNSRIIL